MFRFSTVQNIDGTNLWDSLSDNTSSPRTEILHNIDDIYGNSALTVGPWKLLQGLYSCNDFKNIWVCFRYYLQRCLGQLVRSIRARIRLQCISSYKFCGRTCSEISTPTFNTWRYTKIAQFGWRKLFQTKQSANSMRATERSVFIQRYWRSVWEAKRC